MKGAEENFKLHRAWSIEQETLAWLQDVVCAVHSSFGIAPDGPATERTSHRKVLLLLERLREAICTLPLRRCQRNRSNRRNRRTRRTRRRLHGQRGVRANASK